VAGLWSKLRGWFRTDAVQRSNWDPADDFFSFNGNSYYVRPLSSFGTKLEDIENSFTGYVQQGYKANGVVFAVIQARILLFSEARFQFQPLNNGRPGKLFGNQDLEILEYPWPNGTTGELLARMEQDVSLSGNFYCVRDGDRLRRLRPDWVTIVLSAPPDKAVVSDIVGYVYTPGGRMSGTEPESYLPDEVCHWSPIPDPEAQYRGMSWLTPMAREIQADGAATTHKLKFFHNGASPQMVVKAPPTLTKEQFKEFISETDEASAGLENAYKNLYLGGGADVTVVGADLKQLEFATTQGHGETRICAAGRVPPIIVGLSEGLEAATYSNYGQARRAFGDHWARPQWRSACAALETLVKLPRTGATRLWYDDRDIPFLRDDARDVATIQQTQAITIRQLVDAGYEPDSVVAAMLSNDWSMLKHSGMYSVQLLPPTHVETLPIRDLTTPLEKQAIAPKPAQIAAEQASAQRAQHDDQFLHHYWTRGEGLAKWQGSPTPWTTLYHHLLKFVGPEQAKRMASEWFHEVFGFYAGADLNRVTHGKPPRGHLVGPG
jgi:phage portal protein BeeE